MTKEKTRRILDTLDKEYGITKEGFAHTADWRLLTAIMLSAQSTDKQVDEVRSACGKDSRIWNPSYRPR